MHRNSQSPRDATERSETEEANGPASLEVVPPRVRGTGRQRRARKRRQIEARRQQLEWQRQTPAMRHEAAVRMNDEKAALRREAEELRGKNR